MKVLAPLDLTGNEIQNFVLHTLASAPTPVGGLIYYNSTTGVAYYRDAVGGAWVALGGGGSGGDADTLEGEAGAYYLDRTNHTGTQAAATISDLAATVQAYTLDTFAAAAADVDLDGNKLTNVADPTADTDAANKRYVDLVAQGLTVKGTAYVATAAVLPNSPTYSNGSSGVGATLTAGSNSTLTVDGAVVPANALVLVKDQSTAAQNGLYKLTTAGSGGAPWVLTRADNMNTTGEFVGALVFTEDAGTANPNRAWVCTNSAAPTVGTDAIAFGQLHGAADYSGTSNRITVSAYAIDIAATYVGQTSITTLGTIATGTWQGTAVGVAYGGSGATTAAGARTAFDVPQTPYSALIGNGSSTSFAITQGTHGRAANGKLVVKLYEASSDDEVVANVNVNNSNGTVTISFTTAPTSNQFRVLIFG